ncbi:hypothetical protein OAM37_02025 [bacterium]|nr:hypothetical protein [Rubripirellula sp.]MDC0317281.1 hypothetical protein [bacterium]
MNERFIMGVVLDPHDGGVRIQWEDRYEIPERLSRGYEFDPF